MSEDEEKTHDEDRGLEKWLVESRTIIVGEEIGDSIYRKLAVSLAIMERKEPTKPVTVLVNSPGGSADAGFAMYDLLRWTSVPIRTVANGLVASAAVLVFLAAPKGSRLTLPNSRFMLHQPSTIARGQVTDIDIAARQIIALKRRYNTIVANVTGKPVEQVETDADRDFWLNAQEAKDYGLVDRIIEKRTDLDE
ncbi:MAG: ATP-dependent Clp protease proteolytic subunit [Deltaproteobacteria bacterium]|nr:ATP-dependent Clp protease proteolytic subunit [Deltaproteobacteria bacterium]